MKAQEYAQALFEAVFEVRPQDQDKVLDNFVKILAANGDLKMLDEIEAEYHRLEMKSKGIKEVQITTAREMKSDKAILQELNQIVGEKAEVKRNVDAGLVGGVVVRVDDTLIDASVKQRLDSLKKSITNH